jgi:two-component system response regulator AtoC
MPVYKNGRTILLAEDDWEVCEYLETALKCDGYSVEVVPNPEEALAFVRTCKTPISAILLDLMELHDDGLELLRQFRRYKRDVPVVIVSDTSFSLKASDCNNDGANRFLTKPISPEELRKALIALANLAQGASLPPERSETPGTKQMFFGNAPYMRDLESRLSQIGWSEAPVLIRGETGVGKEMLARALHAHSPRAKKPFLKLNCVALPSELVESELFGYERGAFTGAFEKKLGMFEVADGGTILLDEIGDMDFKLQAKLLQVLQDHEFHRLGGRETIRVNVRVIAATHRELEKGIVEKTFREDLFYRLSVVNIRIPPLRERREDVLAMAELLIKKHVRPGIPPPPRLPAALQDFFLDYDWPGNIRQLESVIRNYLIFQDADIIKRELCSKMRSNSPDTPKPVELAISKDVTPVLQPVIMPMAVELLDPQNTGSVLEQVTRAKEEAERAAISATLKSTNWNRKQAAALLNIDYKALLYKMKKLSIKKERAVPLAMMAAAAAAGMPR